MYWLAEVRNQEYAVEPLLIGQISEPLVGVAKNGRQFRIVIISCAGNRKLQIAMKFEISLQATYPVEKLREPDSLVDIVTRLHEL